MNSSLTKVVLLRREVPTYVGMTCMGGSVEVVASLETRASGVAVFEPN